MKRPRFDRYCERVYGMYDFKTLPKPRARYREYREEVPRYSGYPGTFNPLLTSGFGCRYRGYIAKRQKLFYARVCAGVCVRNRLSICYVPAVLKPEVGGGQSLKSRY